MFEEEGVILEGDRNIAIGVEYDHDDRGQKTDVVRAVVYDMSGPKKKIIDIGEFDDIGYLVNIWENRK